MDRRDEAGTSQPRGPPRPRVPGGKLDNSHIRALVEALHVVVGVLAEADQDDKAQLYREFGLELTYHPEGSVSVRMVPRGVGVSEGRLELPPPYGD